jgi:hypothetical protein
MGGLPHDDHRKEAIADLFRVDIAGVGPELRDERQIEDADPDVKRHADIGNTRRDADREQLDVDEKEQVDSDQQFCAVDVVREPAIQRNESHQHQRLPRGGIRSNLRSPTEQDERLARRLDDGIADQQKKHVDEHQASGCFLTGSYVGEQRQRSIQPGLAFILCE